MNVVREKMLCLFIALCGGGYMAFDYFGPSPAVVVSKETTYLTAPLADDGLPDYALAIIERQRSGVTSENNAAPLLWQAFGPASVTEDAYELICRELGVEPGAGPFLVDAPGTVLARRIAREMRTAVQKSMDMEPTDEQVYAMNDLLDVIGQQPWTVEQIPALESWLTENSAPLDAIVVAAERPRLFSPPPNWLRDSSTPTLAWQSPLLMNVRAALRSLSVRSMNCIARKEYDYAWSDILACWRLGALMGDGPFLVDKFVGIACRGVASNGTLALLQVSDLSPSQAARILRDLRTQPTTLGMQPAFSDYERLYFHDTILRSLTGRHGGIDLSDLVLERSWGSIDSNTVLREGNRWYDRLAATAALPRSAERQAILAEFDRELEQFEADSWIRTLPALVSRVKRSELSAHSFIALLTGVASAALNAQDRDQAVFELTQIAAALAVFKTMHGKYPERLEELRSDILAEIPVDLYDVGKNLPRYERRGDGYLLYCVFENGLDDAGSSYNGEIVNGEWVDEVADYDPHVADLVIRVPRPRRALPMATPTR